MESVHKNISKYIELAKSDKWDVSNNPLDKNIKIEKGYIVNTISYRKIEDTPYDNLSKWIPKVS